MREKAAGMRERAAQTPESALESYTSAFPEADLGALATHLAVAGVSSMFGRSIEARILEMGFDLSRPRYTIVRMLYLSPEGGMAQSDIAQALGVSGSNVSQLIDALVSDGWVERAASPADKRVTYALLTEAGQARASVLVPAIVELMVESCASLTPAEQAELRRLIHKVRSSA